MAPAPHSHAWRSSLPCVTALSIAMGLSLLPASRIAAAEGDQGFQLAATCASCHRPDGKDDGIPSVVGRDAESLIRMMQAFKSGERPGMTMHAVALMLTDEEIAAVARYLAAQGKGGKQP